VVSMQSGGWRRAALTLVTTVVLLVATSSGAAAVVPAGNATGINVRLPFARVAISGKITQAAGGAAANVNVIAVDGSGNNVASVYANAAGKYSLLTLPHGSYRVAVGPGEGGDPTLQWGFLRSSAPGHFTDKLSQASVLSYTGTKLGHRNVALPTGYTISGTITNAGTSAGVENAQVSVETTAPGSNLFNSPSMTTDATGHYQLVGLSRRAYTLQVFHPFPVTNNLQSGCFRAASPGHFTRDCSMASELHISSSSLTGKNVALPNGLVLKGSVKDRTVDAADVCATVTVYAYSTHEFGGYSSTCGNFTIDGLAPGDYEVSVGPNLGFIFVEGHYSPANAEHWVPFTAATPVLHLTGDTDVGVIKPDPGHSFSGHIYDSAGNPLANVAVQATSPDGAYGYHQAETAADGSYSVAGLADRRYILSVRKTFDNFQAGWYAAAQPHQFSARRSHATRLSGAADVTGIDLGLPAGFTISGQVKDPHGNGVRVSVSAAGRGAPRYGYSTGPDGTYTLTDFPPGDYRMYFVPVQTGGRMTQAGWYSATAPGHFTASKAHASLVHVGP
jgi:hypothetical protein